MDFKFLADTVRNIILNTVKEWDSIYTENRPASLFSRSLFALKVTSITGDR